MNADAKAPSRPAFMDSLYDDTQLSCISDTIQSMEIKKHNISAVPIPAKRILSKGHGSDWFGHDYNMNLYRGCHHGCIYCDSRSDCYRIEDFDTVRPKADALAILEREMRAKRKRGVIGMGAMSDPYNRLEGKISLTRGALSLAARYGYGLSFATKSALFARDVDVLAEIARNAPLLIKISFSTVDDALARRVEPLVSSPTTRLNAMARAAESGLFVGALLMPVLPMITDGADQITAVVHAVADAGGRFVYPSFGMSLRAGQREYYYAKLDKSFPGLSQEYRRLYGPRYHCASPRAKALYAAFTKACRARGLLWRMGDIIAAYRKGEGQQLPLF